jgi:hypothetical protein
VRDQKSLETTAPLNLLRFAGKRKGDGNNIQAVLKVPQALNWPYIHLSRCCIMNVIHLPVFVKQQAQDSLMKDYEYVTYDHSPLFVDTRPVSSKVCKRILINCIGIELETSSVLSITR